MKHVILHIAVIAALVGCPHGFGQPLADSVTNKPAQNDSIITSSVLPGSLSVETSRPGMAVMLDAARLGNSPIHNIPVAAGLHILRVVRNDESWFQPAIIETVEIQPNETTMCSIVVPNVYHITSDPFGAEVFLRDSLVGTTPIFLASNTPGSMIRVSKSGYGEETVPLPAGSDEIHLTLQRTMGTGPEPENFLNLEHHTNSTPILLATGVTVATGIAAAYFKIKADNFYSDYQLNGGGAALDKVHSYDRAAGVTLVASEASFLVLTYLLFSR